MSVDDQTCNECAGSEWKLVLTVDYPERRQERNRTVKEVYECQECGSEGKRYNRQKTGTVQFSGVLR